MTEAALQRQIVTYLKLVLPRGWLVHHVANKPRSRVQGAIEKGMGARAGWPDLQIFGPGFVGFLEVKTSKGRLSPKQTEIHHLLRALGFRVEVVRSATDVANVLRDWGIPTREVTP